MIRTAETHPLTWRLRVDQQPVWFDEYRAKQGYVGAEKALAMAPTAVTDQVKAAGLRGRGGAGFPTGVKWSLCPWIRNSTRNTFFVMPMKWNLVLTKIVC
jgi:NADH dehydrogenase subunit F (EC 1.6.5.3)